MKKIYTLSSAMLLSATVFSQNNAIYGKNFVASTTPFTYSAPTDRVIGNPDTTGIVNLTDFLPSFASTSDQVVIRGYIGGGYVFGNNKDGFNICAQGYQNINSTTVKIIGALVWFGAKQRDSTGGATSKVVISAYDMAANKAYNTDGSGTFNQTVLNSPGPTGAVKSTVDLLFDDIDTVGSNMNYVTFATPAYFATDFAIVVDATLTLAAGDTVCLMSDVTGDAAELDYAFHKASTKWFVSDQLFSNPASPNNGTGGLDANIGIFAVLSDATGVDEYFNGMKLTTYPNPAVERATIEYTLEKNSNKISLIVFDQAGRKVIEKAYDSQSAGTYKIDIETADLNAGTYLYQLKANGRNFTKQLIVTK